MSFLLLRLTLMLCVLKNIPVSTAFLPLTPTRFLTTLNENINPLDLLEASYKSSPPSEPIRSDGLTSVSRLRRTTEVNLIMDLCSESGNDDEAIKNLWDFWHNERGSKGKNALVEVDFYMSQPGTWPNAEDILRDLIFENPQWIEPKNKLATLLFLKGQNYDSSLLCEQILQVKPWHFGCLSGAALVYEKLNHPERSLYMRARMMPDRREDRREWCRIHCENIMKQ
ncbi:hypothetical protein TrVE_jg1648 [Triparma verrucosa]|uniref:Uncharacterized protein n=2 Tax=Triparma TaxID=722752 RepID=A0A9W7EG52_9STRA|nr:hypothetical protein TrST_g11705 [Triparma strigata]GMI15505.1 hypothetical protein TrVE_jg1648 [Triparma verrucosa]